jgi:DNA (cytosine-5)-methyltransferase 1
MTVITRMPADIGTASPTAVGNVAELFAGVGGFRLALEGHAPAGLPSAGWGVTWSSQWEPATKRQHASDCYVGRFGSDGHFNEDIARTLDGVEAGGTTIGPVDLLVGGFPCQSYSVARLLKDATGIEGEKGVLWWEIHRFVKMARPRFLLLENVDRLLRSPATQRGRDFGVMLRCLADLGYTVAWRVVNAADYGFPQRRRRTFIVAERDAPWSGDPVGLVLRDGVLARALPVTLHEDHVTPLGRGEGPSCVLPSDLVELSDSFAFEFENSGVMRDGRVWTHKVAPVHAGPRRVLADILVPEDDVPREYFIPKRQLPQWRYLKGAKREARTVERNGFRYFYSEGALPFPDPLDRPSRTILTGEGGSSPSRFKHVVQTPSGRFRRLLPVELERLNGFPDGWTDGMSDSRRAFCMGNALVVGLVHRIARELAIEARITARTEDRAPTTAVAL